jgi:hypothetical protein
VTQDEVVAFDFETGDCIGPIVTLPGLNGQALIFHDVNGSQGEAR